MNSSTHAGAGTDWQRRLLVALLGAALILLAWTYSSTYRAIVGKWYGDTAFSHGFLILPISLWLAWRQRAVLAATDFQPSVLGALLALACTLAWVVARGSGVLVVEQFAAVSLIPALVLAGLGWPATRVLLVPLGFLFFMVPFGRGLVPFLMQATADFATVLLQWTGVPVLRTHMYISIPDGNFEVARACSGLNYFTTSLVLGVLHAYLNFRTWAKRSTCVAAFAVIPVVLNGLRVYITILVSHLTQMRFGPGDEHIMFGRVFFVTVILLLFWFGRRWHDEPAEVIPDPGKVGSVGSRSVASWWPLPLACLIVYAGPPFVAATVARAAEHLSHEETLVRLPPAAPGWQGPSDGAGRWRPMYTGGVVEKQAWYRPHDGQDIEVFVAVYGLGTTVGAEMISYNNLLFPEERGSLVQDLERDVIVPDGATLRVREVVVGYGSSRRLVWQWFVVGEQPVLSSLATKSLEAMAFVTRHADSERIVTLATPLDDGSQARLQAFIDTYGHCAVVGFQGKDCG